MSHSRAVLSQEPVTTVRPLLKVFSIAEMNLDLPSTACLLSSGGLYDRLLGYTVLPFIVLVVMVLPTLWARFHKLNNKADTLAIWSHDAASYAPIFVNDQCFH